MVSITKLAFAIFATLQPLCAIGTSEQAGKFSQDQFEALIEKIPDNNVRNHVVGLYENKNYKDLEVSLLEYLDEYLESSLKGEEREVIERKKESIIDGVAGFIQNAAETGGFEDIDSSFEDSEVMIEKKSVTPAEVAKATLKVQEIVRDYIPLAKQLNATKLLTDKKYYDLERYIYDNIDMDELFGDGDDDDADTVDAGYKVFDDLDSAMKTLHKSVGEPEEPEPVTNSIDPSLDGNSTMIQEIDLFESSMMTDSLSNEEEMISALKNSIAKTEEEIEELISRLNTNEEN